MDISGNHYQKIQLLVLALAVLTVILTQQVQQAYATSVWSFGYNSGKNDAIDDLDSNSSCPDEFSGHADCVVYKTAYTAGYAAERLLHGNDQECEYEPDYCDRDSGEC